MGDSVKPLPRLWRSIIDQGYMPLPFSINALAGDNRFLSSTSRMVTMWKCFRANLKPIDLYYGLLHRVPRCARCIGGYVVEPKRCLFILLCSRTQYNCGWVQPFRVLTKFVKNGYRLDKGTLSNFGWTTGHCPGGHCPVGHNSEDRNVQQTLSFFYPTRTLCCLDFIFCVPWPANPSVITLHHHARPNFLGNSTSSFVTLFCRYTFATLIANILNFPYLVLSAWWEEGEGSVGHDYQLTPLLCLSLLCLSLL